jgi:hypothetical protein
MLRFSNPQILKFSNPHIDLGLRYWSEVAV